MASNTAPESAVAAAATNVATASSALLHQSSNFTVGQLVSVDSRTWPGINQQGGIGRVTGVGARAVSVKYVIDGRHEKEISVQYVHPHNLQQQAALRDRSMLLGRCNRCGSLRTDCGSCDVWMQDELPTSNLSRRRRAVAAAENSSEEEEGSSSSSSSSDDSLALDELVAKHKRDFRRFKRMQAKAKKIIAAANLDSSSESDDDDDDDAKKKKKKKHKALCDCWNRDLCLLVGSGVGLVHKKQ